MQTRLRLVALPTPERKLRVMDEDVEKGIEEMRKVFERQMEVA
jgi:hypothetical protein